jgi:hypothetical protein
MESSDIRVYAKHLQTPSVIHQACIGNWSAESHEPPGEQPQRPGLIDIVFGKVRGYFIMTWSRGINADYKRKGWLKLLWAFLAGLILVHV